MIETLLLNQFVPGIEKIVYMLMYYLVFHLCRAWIFKRAGMKRYYTLIPVYGGMKQFQVAKMSKLWYFYRFVPIILLYKPLFSVWTFIPVLLISALVIVVREARTLKYVFNRTKKLCIFLYLFQVTSWFLLIAWDEEKPKKQRKNSAISILLLVSITTTTIASSFSVPVYARTNDEIEISEDLAGGDIRLEDYDKSNEYQQNLIYSKAVVDIQQSVREYLQLSWEEGYRLVNFEVNAVLYEIVDDYDREQIESTYIIGIATYTSDKYNDYMWQEYTNIKVEETGSWEFVPDALFTNKNVLQKLDLEVLADYQEENYIDLPVTYTTNEEEFSWDLLYTDVRLEEYDESNKDQRNVIYTKSAYSILKAMSEYFTLRPDYANRLVNFEVEKVLYGITDDTYCQYENIYIVGIATVTDGDDSDTYKEERTLLLEEGTVGLGVLYNPEIDMDSIVHELDLQVLSEYQEIHYKDIPVTYDIKEPVYESQYDKYKESLSELLEKSSKSKSAYDIRKETQKTNSKAYEKLKNEIDVQNQLLLELQTLEKAFNELPKETAEAKTDISEKAKIVADFINDWLKELEDKLPQYSKYVKTDDPYMNAVNWVDTNIINPDTLGKFLLVESGKAAIIAASSIAAGVAGAMLANEALDFLEATMVGVIYTSNLVDQGVPFTKAVTRGAEEGLQRYFLNKGLEVAGTVVLSAATKSLSKLLGDTKLGKICKGISDSLTENLVVIKQAITPNVKYLDLSPDEFEQSIFNIDKFIEKEITFEEVQEDLAKVYATIVLQNEKWSWKRNICPGLKESQKKIIREYAKEMNYLPPVKVKKIKGVDYADFYESGYVEYVGYLEGEELNKTSSQQIEIMNKIAKEEGVDVTGKTWHHALEKGRMELVPSGIHNSVYHKGGTYFWGMQRNSIDD